MLKILLKRQLYELNRSFFYDPKKGKSRSKFASAAFIVLYALLMVCVLGGMFAFCAYQLANPLRAAGLDWLYFALFGIIGLMFGVFAVCSTHMPRSTKQTTTTFCSPFPCPSEAFCFLGCWASTLWD